MADFLKCQKKQNHKQTQSQNFQNKLMLNHSEQMQETPINAFKHVATLLQQFPRNINPNIQQYQSSPAGMQKLPQSSSLTQRVTFQSFGSLQGLDQRFSEERKQFIPSLMTKFANLSSQIEIQHNISSFNLIEYDKEDGKIKLDQHMAAARLKRIENNAELKRANIELFMRKRKIQRIKEEKKRELFVDRIEKIQLEDSKAEYQNILKTLAEAQSQKKLEDDNDSFDEDNVKVAAEREKDQAPDGILYFDELKKHPKLLAYTLEKVKEKNMKSDKQKYEKRDSILKFRNQMRTISHSQFRIANKDKMSSSPPQDQYQPQVIFQNISRRIYTKKNHNRLLSEVKQDQRLSSFMHKQEEILESINEKELSKQNYKRLKERFGDLLNELYQIDKKHRIQQKYQKKFKYTMDLFRQSPQLL